MFHLEELRADPVPLKFHHLAKKIERIKAKEPWKEHQKLKDLRNILNDLEESKGQKRQDNISSGTSTPFSHYSGVVSIAAISENDSINQGFVASFDNNDEQENGGEISKDFKMDPNSSITQKEQVLLKLFEKEHPSLTENTNHVQLEDLFNGNESPAASFSLDLGEGGVEDNKKKDTRLFNMNMRLNEGIIGRENFLKSLSGKLSPINKASDAQEEFPNQQFPTFDQDVNSAENMIKSKEDGLRQNVEEDSAKSKRLSLDLQEKQHEKDLCVPTKNENQVTSGAINKESDAFSKLLNDAFEEDLSSKVNSKVVNPIQQSIRDADNITREGIDETTETDFKNHAKGYHNEVSDKRESFAAESKVEMLNRPKLPDVIPSLEVNQSNKRKRLSNPSLNLNPSPPMQVANTNLEESGAVADKRRENIKYIEPIVIAPKYSTECNPDRKPSFHLWKGMSHTKHNRSTATSESPNKFLCSPTQSEEEDNLPLETRNFYSDSRRSPGDSNSFTYLPELSNNYLQKIPRPPSTHNKRNSERPSSKGNLNFSAEAMRSFPMKHQQIPKVSLADQRTDGVTNSSRKNPNLFGKVGLRTKSVKNEYLRNDQLYSSPIKNINNRKGPYIHELSTRQGRYEKSEQSSVAGKRKFLRGESCPVEETRQHSRVVSVFDRRDQMVETEKHEQRPPSVDYYKLPREIYSSDQKTRVNESFYNMKGKNSASFNTIDLYSFNVKPKSKATSFISEERKWLNELETSKIKGISNNNSTLLPNDHFELKENISLANNSQAKNERFVQNDLKIQDFSAENSIMADLAKMIDCNSFSSAESHPNQAQSSSEGKPKTFKITSSPERSIMTINQTAFRSKRFKDSKKILS